MSARSGFFPGDGIGIVSPAALVLLERAVGDVVPALVAELDRDGGIDAVLEAVAGAGLRAVGSFAVAVEEGEALRVIARGDAWVRIAREGQIATVDGAGLRTWNERFVSSWDQVSLALGERVDPPSVFELDHGVVPTRGLVRPNVELARRAQADDTEPIVVAGLPSEELAPHDPTREPPANAEVPGAAVDDPEPSTAPDGAVNVLNGQPERADAAQTLAVGGLGDSAATVLPPMITSAPAADCDPTRNDYDDIFGRTVVRSVQDAAVRPTDEAEQPPQPSPGFVPTVEHGDHDGHTITLTQLREMQRAEAAEGPQTARLGDHDGLTIGLAELHRLRTEASEMAPPPPTLAAGVTVQALVCATGHPNPTHASACSRCGAPLTTQPVVIPRPVLGRLLMSTGEVVELDRSTLIGRNPKITGRLTGELPKVVRLEPFQGVSRSHAMVRLEGWQVLLVDLGSANHTTVTLPGRSPQRLHPDEPVLLSHGALIDLGSGEVTATYESYS